MLVVGGHDKASFPQPRAPRPDKRKTTTVKQSLSRLMTHRTWRCDYGSYFPSTDTRSGSPDTASISTVMWRAKSSPGSALGIDNETAHTGRSPTPWRMNRAPLSTGVKSSCGCARAIAIASSASSSISALTPSRPVTPRNNSTTPSATRIPVRTRRALPVPAIRRVSSTPEPWLTLLPRRRIPRYGCGRKVPRPRCTSAANRRPQWAR